MIKRFLQDRVGLVVAFFVNTGLVLVLTGLLLAEGEQERALLRANTGYAALLCTTVLLIYLGLEYLRWASFHRQVSALADQGVELESLANLPPGQTFEQESFRTLLAQLYSRSVAERVRHQEAHQGHVAFINLWVHQMKTPVSAIHLIAQQAAGQEPEGLKAAMDSVEEETVRLADGLEMVLSMARLQHFAPDYKIERTDLLAAMRRVINSRKKQFIRLKIYPEIEAGPADFTVLTDEKWNRFVLDQIVANALKYGAQGGSEGQKLHVRLERGPCEVVLTIADQGPGIPAEDLPRVFEPFFTGTNGRRFADATGVGLYLVREVTDRLGHRVSIHSEAGQGTVVTLTYQLTNL